MASTKRDDNFIPALLAENDTTNIAEPVLKDNTTDGIYVHIVGNDVGAAGGTASADDADFTATTTQGTPAMGVYESTPTAVTDGDLGIVAIDEDRNLKVNIVAGSSSGTEYTEDAAAAANPVGTAVNLVRQDTPATLVSADGDNVAQRGTNYGAAYVQLVTSAGSYIDSVGGGTQYTEAATDTTITGTAIMWEDTSDTLRAVSATKPLPVDISTVTAINLDIRDLSSAQDTVTANLSATDNAVLDAIEANTTTLAGAVSGTEMQVDVVGSLPAGTNAIGKLSANSGVDIGDVDVTSITNAHSADYDSGAGTDTTLAFGIAVPASGGAAVVPGDATAGLKVDLGADNDITGTVTANLSATDNAVLDQIELNTDPLLVVGGGTEATAQRVTIASDSTGVLSIDDNGGSITVDGSLTVDLGANNDVTVTSGDITADTELPAAAPLDDSTANPTTPMIGGAAMLWNSSNWVRAGVMSNADNDGGGLNAQIVASTLRVFDGTNWDRARGDSTDGLLVNLGSNNDISGTVTANLSATDNGVLDNIDADTSAIQTAVELLDDTVATEGSAIPSKGVLVHGRYDSTSPTSVDDGDAVPILTDAGGRPRVIIQGFQDDNGDSLVDNANNALQTTLVTALPAGTNAVGKVIPPDYDVTSHTAKAVKYYTSAGAATDGIIWSPAAGKRWHVTSLFINVSAAATVTIEDDLAGGDNPIMKMELAANSGVAIPFGDMYPLTSGEDAADLTITTSAGNVYVTAVGYEI